MRGAAKASGDQGARPEATGGAGPFVVLGVLAACVAGAAGYVLTQNTIKQRTADLAAVDAQKQSIKAKSEALRPFADFGTIANARVATVRDLAESRFDWERVLRDLSRAIPADVSLKDITGDLSQSTGGGSVRGAVAAPAITLHGCAPGQTQVARLMARIHNIDGVTRVSLTKSDNALVQSNDQTTGTQARNARPCGTGKRPQFEVVAFFEHAPAAVKSPSIGDGAAGAQPGATPTPTPAAGGSATATPTATATPGGNTTTASSPSQGGATP
jgi:Tfp pilus assembly protein PilN